MEPTMTVAEYFGRRFSLDEKSLSLFNTSSVRKDVSSASVSCSRHSKDDRLDDLRASEYAYLDEQDHVYLDYTGAGLAARSQHHAHQCRLAKTLCGNPHSENPSSRAATTLVHATRARVLAHLNAPPDEYAAIFTPNATGAARLIGEAYPFRPSGRLVLTFDNHNSINGLREFAGRRGMRTHYVHARPEDLRVDESSLTKALKDRRRLVLPSRRKHGRSGLFAFPAQSNYSGVRHPLEWISKAKGCGYDVLLDAAAYLPTAMLDLSVVKPDFVIMSWYKVFGFPTGIGCLVAKRSALARLKRPWFSGGTVKAVAVGVPWHELAPDESAFEDGTLNFLSIPDVHIGLDWITYIGMPAIQDRVHCLTDYFLKHITQLRHSNGADMTIVYGPKDMRDRGGTVTFNFLTEQGEVVDERLVAAESSAARISLRTGCFCNPGAGEDALHITTKALRRLGWTNKPSLDEMIRLLGLPSAGAIRVSFGVASNFHDIHRFFEFAIKNYQDRVTSVEGLKPRDSC